MTAATPGIVGKHVGNARLGRSKCVAVQQRRCERVPASGCRHHEADGPQRRVGPVVCLEDLGERERRDDEPGDSHGSGDELHLAAHDENPDDGGSRDSSADEQRDPYERELVHAPSLWGT